MFVVSTATYPLSKTTEMARKFIKAQETPLPPFIKRVNTLIAAVGEQGLKVLGIYEIDDGKLAEGIKEISKRQAQFFEVEGYRLQMEPMLTPEEAIPMLGL